ncbi:MAG: hypothetical protein O3C65_12075 [Proteobacteria bacterium]|nr:hypothetical protein [Pseudomonadota bacterium]MDA1059412.1 hypothetical protein [Pseudomonadota bacterium]
MRRPVTDPARLSYLVDQKLRLTVWCIRCDHRADIAVAPLVDKLGANYPIPHVARHMKCSRCGNREITVNPTWNDEDVPGRPKSMTYPPLRT